MASSSTRASEVLAEETGNRLLRRADWRFFLPDPHPDKTICFGGDSLLESLRLISRTVVDGRRGGEARGCDLAVAVDPDRRTLALARSSLRPGGFLYTEWRGVLRRGKGQVRRRLESAGFEGASLYWPFPDPSVANPAAWIALREGRALRYYFIDNRWKASTVARRVAYKIIRVVFASAPRLHMAQPVCALARKPTASVAGKSGSGLDQLVASRWTSWGLGPAPKSLSWLLLTGGLRSNSKVIGLVFAESSPTPVIALKMPRMPEWAPTIWREASVLRDLVKRLGASAPPGIPRFLFLESHGSVPVLGETAFVGIPLLSACSREDYGDFALKASAWLADFAGRRAPIPRNEWWHRLVDPVLAEFADSFGCALDSRLLHESEALLKTLPSLPLVCEQRDFSPWNVLLTPSGELAVVDWESAELDGLPALDLIYFLTNLCFSFDFARRTGRYRESYRNMLDPNTPKGSLAARCFSAYGDKIGLESAAFRPLRLLTWLVHARSEYHRLQADFGPALSAEILRAAVCVQLWEEELRGGQERGGNLA